MIHVRSENPSTSPVSSIAALAWHLASSSQDDGSGTKASSAAGDGVPDLTGRKIMVCEDQVLIAYDIAAAVEDAGGEVLGPFAAVTDAAAALARTEPDAAVLDVNLLDGDITPVLEKLVEAGVPVVVNTGTKIPDTLAAVDVPVFLKPTEPEELLAALASD